MGYKTVSSHPDAVITAMKNEIIDHRDRFTCLRKFTIHKCREILNEMEPERFTEYHGQLKADLNYEPGETVFVDTRKPIPKK